MTNLVQRAIAKGQIAAVILSSGKASRMGPLGRAMPKAALPAGNLRLADFQVQAVRSWGGQDVFLTVPQHPSAADLETYYDDSALHGIKVIMHRQEEIRGTLGAVNQLFAFGQINSDVVQTVGVLFGDAAHNIDARPILAAHLENRADLTVGVYRIPWSASDWRTRSFGTIIPEGMPKRADFQFFEQFKEEQEKYVESVRGQIVPVERFCEKADDESRDIPSADSNLVLCGIMFFSIKLWRDIAPFISPSYFDIGHHLLPMLGGEQERFAGEISREILTKIEKRRYSFYAYIIPKQGWDNQPIYWRNINTPAALLGLNQDIANGLLNTRIESADMKYWRRIQPHGYAGTSEVDLTKVAIKTPEGFVGVGPIIGSHTTISGTEIGATTVIGDYNHITAGSISNSLIFGGRNHTEQVLIGGGFKINRCIILGPISLRRADNDFMSLGHFPRLQNLIIYPHKHSPLLWRWDPLDAKF